MCGNLPAWPGASKAYSFLYAVLRDLGASAYAAQVTTARKHRRAVKFHPTDEMREIIEALNKGAEATIKGLKLHYIQQQLYQTQERSK
jgi:ribosomal protein L16 Arg81 hydroxylase